MSHNEYGRKLLKGFRNYRVPPRLTALAIRSFLQALDCPRALTVLILYESGEHEQLAKLEFDPLWYDSFQSIRDSYAATKFLSKFRDLSLDYDIKEVALQKFKKFELLCKNTNSRFRNLSIDPQFNGSIVWLHNAVIRKIERILGEFCPEEFFSKPDWGPGASTLIRRRDASSAIKFQCETGITRDLYFLLPPQLMREVYPHWTRHLEDIGYPNFQIGNKIITVPKDSTTDRVIAIEPGINIWFQLSIGNMIKRRLLRVGVDLTDQSRNQRLARLGSISGELATIDLSSASDSISLSVVESLLPPRWFSVMDSCRSHHGVLDSLKVRWEKFSSMGNGFTFPLQSLIFFAIATSCVEYSAMGGNNSVAVYGDDIIIPTSSVKLFTECLDFYGFRINEKKTFVTSSFRESCGAHYYSGFDVKPIYLKDSLTSVSAIYRLANAVRRLAWRRCNYIACSAELRSTFELLVRTVPKALRLRIPETLGDGGFISNLDESSPSRMRHGIEGYRVTHLTTCRNSYKEERLGYLLAELWRLSKFDRDEVPFESRPSVPKAIARLTDRLTEGEGRNSVPSPSSAIRLSKGIVVQWPDLGSWF